MSSYEKPNWSHDARPHVRHEDVGLVEQAARRCAPSACSRLSARLRLPRLSISNGGFTGIGRPERAGEESTERVAGRRFDLDDVGAPVAEDRRRRRPRDPHPHFDDLDAFERTGHGEPPAMYSGNGRCASTTNVDGSIRPPMGAVRPERASVGPRELCDDGRERLEPVATEGDVAEAVPLAALLQRLDDLADWPEQVMRALHHLVC